MAETPQGFVPDQPSIPEGFEPDEKPKDTSFLGSLLEKTKGPFIKEGQEPEANPASFEPTMPATPLFKSFLPLPEPLKGESLPGKVGAGAANFGIQTAGSVLSPGGLMTLPLGLLGRLGGAIAAGGFGVPAVKEGLHQVYEGAALEDPQEVTEGALKTLSGGLITAGGAHGLLSKKPVVFPTPEKPPIIPPPKISEVIPEDRPPTVSAVEGQPTTVTQPAPSAGAAESGVTPPVEPAIAENNVNTTEAQHGVIDPSVTPTVTEPKIEGLGGAIPEEVQPTGTGLKNAVGEMERVGLGLAEAPETVQRNMAQAWVKSGEVEAAKPGTGKALADSLIADPERGLSDGDSALLLRHKTDLFNRLNDAAERTHVGDKLAREAAQAEHASLLNDFNSLLDAVNKRGASWGREGRWRQAMSQEDFTFSSTDDLNRYHRAITGEDLPGKDVGNAGKVAERVKVSSQEADTATAEATAEIKKKVPQSKSPTASEAERAALDAANKTVRENAVRISDLDSKLRVSKTVQERRALDIQRKAAEKTLADAQKVVRDAAVRAAKEESTVKEQVRLNEQSKTAKAALDAAAKTVRDNAKRLADLETQARVAKTVQERNAASVQAKAAAKAVKAADKLHRDAAIALAKAQRALRDDPVKAVWSKVGEMIDKGEGDFDTIRNRVATDLGMKVKAVTRIMAQDSRTKYLMNEAWKKQQKAALLRQEAKRWVAGVDTPESIKLLKGIPRISFGIKTFGHGTVPLGTHAPWVAFQPVYWGKYFSAYKTMYKMVVSKAFYQQQVRDLQMRPNYTEARRAGLVNDPTAYEDYTNPQITKFITGGQIGNRGFTVLKILRQDMFDQQWNKLPKSLQIPEVAKAIATAVNHDTGVVQAMAPKGLGTALFAPRLEASRVMTLLGDPLRAAKILTKPAWGRVTPGERIFAINQLKSKAMIAGTMYALLKANQGILSAIGSKQQVNTDDPMKSDFLKFKVAGMDFAYGNAMLSMARMPLSLYRVVSRDKGKMVHLVYDDESVATVLARFTRSQLSPFMGTLTDLGLGSDYASRPLPSKVFGTVDQNRPVPKRLAAQGFEQYTWPEYWSEQLTPIPGQESIKEIWKYGLGMNDEQIEALGRALAISAVMGATGGRLTEDYDLKER